MRMWVGVHVHVDVQVDVDVDGAVPLELAKVAAEYGGIYISHIRDEEDQLLESVEELITIAREARIPAEIYHLKASGQHNWHKLDSVFLMIEKNLPHLTFCTQSWHNFQHPLVNNLLI